MTPRLIPIHLGDLRLGEEFETSCLHLAGRIEGWGYMRPSGYWTRNGAPRPRWPAVLCLLDGRRQLFPPELVVLVEASRLHWRMADEGPRRWAKPVSARA